MPKKRRWVRKIFSLLVIIFVVIQFFQPDKNNNDVIAKNDIGTMLPMSDTVQQLLKTSCYDCHSNNTYYPWYSNIQPTGWWLKNHIEDGKKHLNFNEFVTLPPRNGKTTRQRQDKKLQEIKETIDEDEMPLNSYLWIHHNAKLNAAQKKLIGDWADSARKTLSQLPALVDAK